MTATTRTTTAAAEAAEAAPDTALADRNDNSNNDGDGDGDGDGDHHHRGNSGNEPRTSAPSDGIIGAAAAAAQGPGPSSSSSSSSSPQPSQPPLASSSQSPTSSTHATTVPPAITDPTPSAPSDSPPLFLIHSSSSGVSGGPLEPPNPRHSLLTVPTALLRPPGNRPLSTSSSSSTAGEDVDRNDSTSGILRTLTIGRAPAYTPPPVDRRTFREQVLYNLRSLRSSKVVVHNSFHKLPPSLKTAHGDPPWWNKFPSAHALLFGLVAVAIAGFSVLVAYLLRPAVAFVPYPYLSAASFPGTTPTVLSVADRPVPSRDGTWLFRVVRPTVKRWKLSDVNITNLAAAVPASFSCPGITELKPTTYANNALFWLDPTAGLEVCDLWDTAISGNTSDRRFSIPITDRGNASSWFSATAVDTGATSPSGNTTVFISLSAATYQYSVSLPTRQAYLVDTFPHTRTARGLPTYAAAFIPVNSSLPNILTLLTAYGDNVDNRLESYPFYIPSGRNAAPHGTPAATVSAYTPYLFYNISSRVTVVSVPPTLLIGGRTGITFAALSPVAAATEATPLNDAAPTVLAPYINNVLVQIRAPPDGAACLAIFYAGPPDWDRLDLNYQLAMLVDVAAGSASATRGGGGSGVGSGGSGGTTAVGGSAGSVQPTGVWRVPNTLGSVLYEFGVGRGAGGKLLGFVSAFTTGGLAAIGFD